MLLIPLVYSITLEEVINSYDFSYASEDFQVNNITYNETLNIQTTNNYGDYELILTLGENIQLEKDIFLGQGNNNIIFNLPEKYLDEDYNLSLKVYKENTLVYRNYNAYQLNKSNQSQIILEITNHYIENNNLIINLNNTNNQTIKGIINNKYKSNAENNQLFFNLDTINDKNLILTNLIIEDQELSYFLKTNYSINYDSGKSKILKYLGDKTKDLNNNDLIDNLILEFELDLRDTENYELEILLEDEYKSFSKTIKSTVNNNFAEVKINGRDLYKDKLSGPYKISKVTLLKQDEIIDSVVLNNFTKEYSYKDFEKHEMPDLEFTKINLNSTQLDFTIKNSGNIDSFAISLIVVDNEFNKVYEKLIPYILKNATLDLELSTNKTNLTLFIDYDSSIEELSEENNYITWPLPEGICSNETTNELYDCRPVQDDSICNGLNTLRNQLILIDSNCNPISNARINLLKVNNNYITYVKTNVEGIANFTAYNNSDANKFQIDYNGAKQETSNDSFYNGTIIQTKAYELNLFDSNNISIPNTRVNLLKSNGNYVTYTKTDVNGTASFEVLPNSEMMFEIDYNGAKYNLNVSNNTPIIFNTKSYSLELIDSNNISIPNTRVNLLKSNGNYVTYRKTNVNGTASFEVLPNSEMIFEIDYNGAKYKLNVSNNTPIKFNTESYSLNLLSSNNIGIANARVNLLKSNSNYVTYTKTNVNGTASFEVLPNSEMIFEIDYNGAKYKLNVSNNTPIIFNTKSYSLELLTSNNVSIPNARVNLLKSNGNYVTYTKTNVEGIASFEVLPDSEMIFEIDYNGAKYQTDLIINETIINVKTYLFGGLFLNNFCEGTPNVRFNLLKSDENYVTYTKTDSDGIGRFEVLPNSNMIIQVDYESSKYNSNLTLITENTMLDIKTLNNTVCYNNISN